MTREEIKELKGLGASMGLYDDKNPCKRAVILGKAIKELEREPIIDKIRAEILNEAEYAYADFDRYKEDILRSEPDELPDDDFRYGLERAVEIVDKHRKEAET